MGYSIQNSETGEVDYIQNDVSSSIEHLDYDEETGEPFNGQLKVRYPKLARFQIPKKLLKGTACEEFEKRLIGDEDDADREAAKGIHFKIIKAQNDTDNDDKQQIQIQKNKQKLYDRDDYINMEGVKNDIIFAYNKSNILLFLVPTLFCFNIVLATIICVLEMLLHLWSHMKNGLNMNKMVYYRSPLHVLTSQFCATCRSESEMDIEIFQMLNEQMRQARESSTLKDVSKALT